MTLPTYREVDRYLFNHGFRIDEQRFATLEDAWTRTNPDGTARYDVVCTYLRSVRYYKYDVVKLYGHVITKSTLGLNASPQTVYRIQLTTAEGNSVLIPVERITYWRDILNRNMPDRYSRKPKTHPMTSRGTTDITSYNRRHRFA